MKKQLKNNHYVYKLISLQTGEFYFGSRSCNCNPDEDNYMGSMKRWKPNKENLIKEIIKRDFCNREDAILFESELIKNNINNSLNRNYYIPTIGFVNKICSAETKQKIKQALIGKPFSEEHKKKLSKSRIEKGIAIGKNNGMFGKTHTQESKLKMAINKGRIFSDEVRKRMGDSKRGLKRKNETIQKLRNSQPNAKCVNQYSMDGVLINTFKSIAEAARQTLLHKSAINTCCLGCRNQHGGYKWKYKI